MKKALWLFVAFLLSGSALAQESRTARKLDEMNRAAMEKYDGLEVDAAKKILGDALAFAKKNKLEKSPQVAQCHRNLGIVLGAGMNDQDAALLEFIAALQIDPTLKLDAAYRSPALQKTFDQAKATVTGVRETVPSPAPVPLEERGLRHTPIEDSLRGQAILISARVGADLKAHDVILGFRPAGVEGWTVLPMKAATATVNGTEYQAVIPDSATQKSTLQYYLEARRADGRVLSGSGSADAPHIVSIAQPGGKQAGDGENPIETTTVPRAAESGRPSRSFWIGVSLGTGGGYISGETEVSHQQVTCCLAPAPFHVLGELGYWFTPHTAISLAARIGFPLGANVAGAATLAPSFIGRFSYMTGEYGGLVVHGDLGGGFIRHVIELTATSATAAMGDKDTFASGPLIVGAGIGWNKPLGDTFHFVVDLDILAGIPIIDTVGSGSRPTKLGWAVNGDLSIGVQVGF